MAIAIKIRCSDCRKKISIDEAFAGGVCRCPYCTALVFVPAAIPGAARPGRPASPGARPAAPGDRPAGPEAEAEASPEQQAREAIAAAESEGLHVPVAAPVRLQGIATIVMLAVLLALLCGGGYVVVTKMSRPKTKTNGNGTPTAGDNGNGNGTGQPGKTDKFNPFMKPGVLGSGIDGMKIDSPIIYCIEGGSSMQGTLNYAVAMTRVSVRSLTADHKFNVVLGEEGGQADESWFRFLLKDYNGGGEAGEHAIAKPLDDVAGTGAPDVSRLFKAVLSRKPIPHTIVFFACKPIPEAEELGKLAKAQGVKIVTICLTNEASISGPMAKMAELTGGDSRAHSIRDLDRWATAANFD